MIRIESKALTFHVIILGIVWCLYLRFMIQDPSLDALSQALGHNTSFIPFKGSLGSQVGSKLFLKAFVLISVFYSPYLVS